MLFVILCFCYPQHTNDTIYSHPIAVYNRNLHLTTSNDQKNWFSVLQTIGIGIGITGLSLLIKSLLTPKRTIHTVNYSPAKQAFLEAKYGRSQNSPLDNTVISSHKFTQKEIESFRSL